MDPADLRTLEECWDDFWHTNKNKAETKAFVIQYALDLDCFQTKEAASIWYDNWLKTKKN